MSDQDEPRATGGYAILGPLAWLMRALAVLSIGGALKLVLVVRDSDGSAITTVLAALAGLAVVGLLWTVGECAAALRDLTVRRS